MKNLRRNSLLVGLLVAVAFAAPTVAATESAAAVEACDNNIYFDCSHCHPVMGQPCFDHCYVYIDIGSHHYDNCIHAPPIDSP